MERVTAGGAHTCLHSHDHTHRERERHLGGGSRLGNHRMGTRGRGR